MYGSELESDTNERPKFEKEKFRQSKFKTPGARARPKSRATLWRNEQDGDSSDSNSSSVKSAGKPKHHRKKNIDFPSATPGSKLYQSFWVDVDNPTELSAGKTLPSSAATDSYDELLVKHQVQQVMEKASALQSSTVTNMHEVSTVSVWTAPVHTVVTTSVTSTSFTPMYGEPTLPSLQESNTTMDSSGSLQPGQVAQSWDEVHTESLQSGHGLSSPGLSPILADLAISPEPGLREQMDTDMDTGIPQVDVNGPPSQPENTVSVVTGIVPLPAPLDTTSIELVSPTPAAGPSTTVKWPTFTDASRFVTITTSLAISPKDVCTTTSVLTGAGAAPRVSSVITGAAAPQSTHTPSWQPSPLPSPHDALQEVQDSRMNKRPRDVDSGEATWADDVAGLDEPPENAWVHHGAAGTAASISVRQRPVEQPPKVQRTTAEGSRRATSRTSRTGKQHASFAAPAPVAPGTRFGSGPKPETLLPPRTSASRAPAPRPSAPRAPAPKSSHKPSQAPAASTTRNRQSDEPSAQTPRRLRPPLIVVRSGLSATAFAEMRALRQKFDEDFVARHYSTSSTFQMASSSDHFKMTEFLKSRGFRFHTWPCPEDRNGRVVIRQLPIDTPPETLQTALEEKGIQVQKVLRMAKRGSAPEPYPLFLVVLEGTANLHDILKLTNLEGVAIRVELYRGGGRITQCYRCQGLGHTSHGCHEAARCVKCGQQHDAKECPLPSDASPTCCLCGGPHTANYSKCPHRLRWLSKHEQRRPTQTQAKRAAPPPSSSSFPSLPGPSGASTSAGGRSYARVTAGPSRVQQQQQQQRPPDARPDQSDASDVMSGLREVLSMFRKLDICSCLAQVREALNRFRTAQSLFEKCEALLGIVMTVVDSLSNVN